MNQDYQRYASSQTSAMERELAASQVGSQILGGISPARNEPPQPVTARVATLLKQAHDMGARLTDIANSITGPQPTVGLSVGDSAAVQIEPPLSQTVDHLASAMQRMQREIERIAGAL